MIKMNKKEQKAGLIRVGSTWMRRGTQGHVAAPRGPTRHTYIYIYILYILYKGYSAVRRSERYSNPLIRRAL